MRCDCSSTAVRRIHISYCSSASIEPTGRSGILDVLTGRSARSRLTPGSAICRISIGPFNAGTNGRRPTSDGICDPDWCPIVRPPRHLVTGWLRSARRYSSEAPTSTHAWDPIVRAEAPRLRIRIEECYRTEGQSDRLVVTLPKGSYVPQFMPALSRGHRDGVHPPRLSRHSRVRPGVQQAESRSTRDHRHSRVLRHGPACNSVQGSTALAGRSPFGFGV